MKTGVGLPEPDPANPKQSWYDELVRIPDFLAGPLARWDYKKNLVPGRGKYVDLLQGAVADNPYLVVLLLSQWGGGIGVGRLLTSKNPFFGLSAGWQIEAWRCLRPSNPRGWRVSKSQQAHRPTLAMQAGYSVVSQTSD
jgi:hypothetical protein